MKKTTISILMSAILLLSCLVGCHTTTTPSVGSDSASSGITESESALESAPIVEENIKMKKKPTTFNEIDYSHYGLQITEDGTITLNGKPFYGMGVNFNPAFSLCLDKQFFFDKHTNLEAHFKALSEGGIPCIRVMFGVFYGKDVSLFDEGRKREQYLAAMDYLVALAEKYQIGIIASLFWEINAFLDYCEETMDCIADPDSQSNQHRKTYIREVVGRYKYSPAIWAWEIGNELNLAVDITNTKFIDSNGNERIFSSELLTSYYTIIGSAIREEDPYRMITGGDAAPRDASMALYHTQGASWSPKNTYEDYKTAFQWYTPNPLNAMSLHYPKLGDMKDFVKMAKELKIGLFVGEFHGDLFENYGDKLSPEENDDEAREQDTWYAMRDAYYESGVQLAISWTYGSYSQGLLDHASLELGVRDGVVNNYYVLEGLQEINNRYEREGKTDAGAYWEQAVKVILESFK